MSTLQNLATYQLTPHPASPAGNRMRRRIAARHEPLAQEPGGAESNEDQELINQALAGDLAAQSRLFATHTPRLYRVAFSVLRNNEDAEDAVQDGWCSAYSNLRAFEGRSSLSTWLTRIVINSALMIRRRNKRQFLISSDEVSDEARGVRHSLVDEQPAPEEVCQDREMNELRMREIQQLPSAIRIAFLLREVDELSPSESLERLGINESALKSRVLRARRKIAQNMGQLLHAGRQRNAFIITDDCRLANASSTATSSTGEASHDRV